jgi:hypothetical protein
MDKLQPHDGAIEHNSSCLISGRGIGANKSAEPGSDVLFPIRLSPFVCQTPSVRPGVLRGVHRWEGRRLFDLGDRSGTTTACFADCCLMVPYSAVNRNELAAPAAPLKPPRAGRHGHRVHSETEVQRRTLGKESVVWPGGVILKPLGVLIGWN